MLWFPTIWKDEDWDHSHVYEILIKKLEHKRDFFSSNRPYSSQAKETATKDTGIFPLLSGDILLTVLTEAVIASPFTVIPGP